MKPIIQKNHTNKFVIKVNPKKLIYYKIFNFILNFIYLI